MASKYVLSTVSRGQYRFTLSTHSGQLLLTSGLFVDKDSALRAIEVTRNLIRNFKNYEIGPSTSGGYDFVIKTAKGEVLAHSATYPDEESLRIVMNTTKGVTRGARVEDLTRRAVRPGPPSVKLW